MSFFSLWGSSRARLGSRVVMKPRRYQAVGGPAEGLGHGEGSEAEGGSPKSACPVSLATRQKP